MSTQLVKRGSFDLEPRTLSEVYEFADILSKSGMTPKNYFGKPGDIVIAMKYGSELGLPLMQAVQSIAVINGRPSIWGDGALAVVYSSGLVEDLKEMSFDEIVKAGKAVCWTKRRNKAEPVVRSFSIDDAKRAHLWGKTGPWTDYWPRMLQMRARGLCLRDAYPDVLKGISIAEEVVDIPTVEQSVENTTRSKIDELKQRLSTQVSDQVLHQQAAPVQPPTEHPVSAPPEEPQVEEHPPFDSLPSQPADPPPAATTEKKTGPLITEGQRKMLYAVGRGAGMTDTDFKEFFARMGYKSTNDVLKSDVDDIKAALESWSK